MPIWLVKHYFWVNLWGCFLKRLAFELANRVMWPAGIIPNVHGHRPARWGPQHQKARERRILSFSAWAETPLFRPQTSAPLVVGLWDSGQSSHHQLSWFSDLRPQTEPLLAFLPLQLVASRLQGLSAPWKHGPIPIEMSPFLQNESIHIISYNKYLHLYLYHLYLFNILC